MLRLLTKAAPVPHSPCITHLECSLFPSRRCCCAPSGVSLPPNASQKCLLRGQCTLFGNAWSGNRAPCLAMTTTLRMLFVSRVNHRSVRSSCAVVVYLQEGGHGSTLDRSESSVIAC